MRPKEALYNAARHYCRDRHAQLGKILLPDYIQYLSRSDGPPFWRHPSQLLLAELYQAQSLGVDLASARRAVTSGAGHPELTQDEAGALGARSTILAEFLDGIERFDPAAFRSPNQMRAHFIQIGQTARVMRRTSRGRQIVEERAEDLDPHEQAAVEAERLAFLAYASRVSLLDAAAVPSVPYRRILNDRKRSRIIDLLVARWGIDPYVFGLSYPLRRSSVSTEVLTLWSDPFYVEGGIDGLKGLLRDHGVTRAWGIHESPLAPDCEADLELVDSFIHGETYWSSPENDWLVYESHEHTIMFAGTWLVEAVKEKWPAWERWVFTGWGGR